MIQAACTRGVLRCLLLAAAALAIFGWSAATATAAPAPADFTWSPQPAVVEEPTVFTAVEDRRIVEYRWDLDGNGAYDDSADRSGPQVTRIFQNVRTYTIGLRTTDEEATVRETTRSVRVVAPGTPQPPNSPPEASFVFFPAGPMVGEPITFVSTSTDADSPVPASGMRWDLNGDGVFDDAEGPSATASFPAPGTYTISLSVTTNATDVTSLLLNVGAPGSPPAPSVGQRALSLMSPFPVVRIAGRISRRGVRIRRLTVDAPPGTGVKLRCGGRGCPFRRLLRTVSARVRANSELPPTRVLRIRPMERKLLRPGVTLRLYVTRADAVGKFTRFRIRRSKPPVRSDRCLVPGSGRPLACPSR